jgi:hypothetical protein
MSHLVIVSANTCGACKSYYSNVHSDVEKALKEIKVNLVEVKFKDMNSAAEKVVTGVEEKNKSVISTYMTKFATWFPMFIFFTDKEWTSILQGSTDFKGVIMNGEITQGKVNYKREGYPMSKDGIISWINAKNKSDGGIIPLHDSTAKVYPSALALKTDSVLKTCSGKFVPSRR